MASDPAQGFGAHTPGGKGGRIFEVSTLADGGPGSLREAVEAKGPRQVVFRVAGVIRLEKGLAIREPFLTIDGSTAPAPGITLTDASVSIGTHDVIVRYLRIRAGDRGKTKPSDVHGFALGYASNVLIDHCSIYWGIDENIGMYQCRNVTVQWSILAEALHRSKHEKGPHSMGILIGGDQTGNVSLHHCLLASNNQRNPRIQNGVSDVRNNVFYNWGTGAGYFTGKCQINFVGNLYSAGPDSKRTGKALRIGPDIELYLRDSALEEGSTRVEDWDMVAMEDGATPRRAEAPFVVPPVGTLPLGRVFEAVLARVGAILPGRDSVDAGLIEGVRTKTNRIIDRPSQSAAAAPPR